MASINISDESKAWFDDYKQADENQGEAFERMIREVEAFNGNVVDPEELANQLKPFIAAGCELGAFRGCKAYMEEQSAVKVKRGP